MADTNEPDFDNMTDEEIDEVMDRITEEDEWRWNMEE